MNRNDGALCTGCGRPVEGDGYYCPHCGAATSNRTPYVPDVNIPFNYAPFGSVWEGIDKSGVRGWRRVTLYALFGLLFAPFFVIASPFILAEWIRNRKARRRNPTPAGGSHGASRGKNSSRDVHTDGGPA